MRLAHLALSALAAESKAAILVAFAGGTGGRAAGGARNAKLEVADSVAAAVLADRARRAKRLAAEEAGGPGNLTAEQTVAADFGRAKGRAR